MSRKTSIAYHLWKARLPCRTVWYDPGISHLVASSERSKLLIYPQKSFGTNPLLFAHLLVYYFNMSFKDTLSWLDQLISRQNDFFYKTPKNYQDQLEPFSGRESQDIYCWLEKFENQFKSCGRKLDVPWSPL